MLVLTIVLTTVLIIIYYLFLAPVCIDLTDISSNFTLEFDQINQVNASINKCVYHKVSPGVFVGESASVPNSNGDKEIVVPTLLIYEEVVDSKKYYYAVLVYTVVLNISSSLKEFLIQPASVGVGIIPLNPDNGSHVNIHFIKRLGVCNVLTSGINVQNTASMNNTSSAVTSKLTNKLSYGFGSLTIKVV